MVNDAIKPLAGVILLGTLGIYGIGSYSLGPKPWRWNEAAHQINITRESDNRRHKELHEKIFGQNGYAHKDDNNALDFNELVDVIRRLDKYKDVPFRADNFHFPYLELGELETIAASYEAEKKQQSNSIKN